jgi:hypothetical protein
LGLAHGQLWPASINSKHVSYRPSLTINRLLVSTVSVMVGICEHAKLGEPARSDTACTHWTLPSLTREPEPSKVGLIGWSRPGRTRDTRASYREGKRGRPLMGTIFGLNYPSPGLGPIPTRDCDLFLGHPEPSVHIHTHGRSWYCPKVYIFLSKRSAKRGLYRIVTGDSSFLLSLTFGHLTRGCFGSIHFRNRYKQDRRL